MKKSISKWGNSLAFRIPNAIAEDAKISLGDEVEVHCDSKGRIVISKAVEADLTEKSILASLDGTNLGEYWDEPIGKEEL